MLGTGKKQALETIAIAAYAILLAVVSCFHEPWFDEAQAWLIARDSSMLEMIWDVMRYEGHTPLWHLVLYIPAHLGVPFEPGLKTVNFIFATLAAAVLIKYSPFPLWIRLLLPFTYFPFYQYGVISRCYSLFMLVLWLTAVAFPKRNERPFLFSLLLALLGGTMAYGMLIAFGIAAAWFIEIISSHRQKMMVLWKAATSTVSDRRFHSLIFLGLVNLIYVAILWPMPDKYTAGLDYVTYASRVYRLLAAPVGSLFLTEDIEFFATGINSPFLIFVATVGFLLILIFIGWAVAKGTFYFAVIPYFTLTLFMTFVYFSIHHTGIYTLLILFVFWISAAGNKHPGLINPIHKWKTLFSLTGRYSRFLNKAGTVALACLMSLQIYWAFAASRNDIKLPYAPFKELASFIKGHELTQYKIFDFYNVSKDKNLYMTGNLAALSYFPKNIFYNHNPFNHKISYASHRVINDIDLIDYLKNKGRPEIILHHKDTLPFYDDIFSLSDYSPVKAFEGYYMWKDSLMVDSVVMFVRKDILPQFDPG